MDTKRTGVIGKHQLYNTISGKKLDNCLCDKLINIGMAGNLGRRICARFS